MVRSARAPRDKRHIKGFYALFISFFSAEEVRPLPIRNPDVVREFPCNASTPPPVPKSFQDLYTSLNNYLDSFNTTLNSQWNGVKYPVLFTANLWDASAEGGPQQMLGTGALATIQAQLQELKAMGVQAVTVEVGFPMLYEPF